MDLVKMATYPFLSQVREWIRQEGININEILWDDTYERARHLGRTRVENALEKIYVGERSLADEIDCMLEIFSYPIARMITTCIHDDFLSGRYALAEARHAAHHLKNESGDFIGDVAKEVDIDIRQDDSIMIHFTEYLKYSPTKYKSWKLVNRPLKKGWITLQKKEMVRLIQEALSKKIFTEVLDASPSGDIREGLREEIAKIQNMLTVHKEKMGETEISGGISIVRFPPCMKKILGAMQTGINIPHTARFALVAFLNGIGLDTNKILTLFSSSPDFDKGKTKYQVEHITGKASGTHYSTPSCESLKTWGLCPGEDDLCKTISHPLNYYKKKKKTKK